MNMTQLKDKIKEIEKKKYEETIEAIKEYCMSNNPYSKGSIFTDHIGSIIIEKIECHISKENPCCIYYGVELKKDKVTIKKNNPKRYAYQCNEKKGE
jgi:hypothetical protein